MNRGKNFYSTLAPFAMGGWIIQGQRYKWGGSTASTTSATYVQVTSFTPTFKPLRPDSVLYIVPDFLNLATEYNYGLHKLTATPSGGSEVIVWEVPAAYGRGAGGTENPGIFRYTHGTTNTITFKYYLRCGYGGATVSTALNATQALSVNVTNSAKDNQNSLWFYEVDQNIFKETT